MNKKNACQPRNGAYLTLPSGFVIKPSGISGAGEGVWTTQVVEKGTLFGPYEGVHLRLDCEVEAYKSGYCWEVSVHSIFVFY